MNFKKYEIKNIFYCTFEEINPEDPILWSVKALGNLSSCLLLYF